MHLGILLALSSAIAYGAADFVGGVGTRRRSSWRIVLVGQAAGTVAGVGFGILFIALAQISDGAGLLHLAANQPHDTGRTE